jgi:predicted RNA-binding Zn-ribbon protein involved in translation (DUF1610 family)
MAQGSENDDISIFSLLLAKKLTSQCIYGIIMKPEKVLEVCPVCGSSELYLEAGGYTGKVYHCKNCDYMGALIVEADEEMARAIREDYKQSGQKRRDD